MINRVITGWSFWRLVRLALGLYILIDGIMSGMWGFAGLGVIFTLMPLLNVGCCAGGNCTVDRDVQQEYNADDEVIHEEVK